MEKSPISHIILENVRTSLGSVPELLPQPVLLHTFQAADEELAHIAGSSPDTVWVAFIVIWENGDLYRGAYRIAEDDRIDSALCLDLAGDIEGKLKCAAGYERPANWDDNVWRDFCEQAKNNGVASRARDALVQNSFEDVA